MYVIVFQCQQNAFFSPNAVWMFLAAVAIQLNLLNRIKIRGLLNAAPGREKKSGSL